MKYGLRTSNERVWCTAQLAKLSFYHSINRSHSPLTFSTFYKILYCLRTKPVLYGCWSRTNDAQIIWKIIWKSPRAFRFLIKNAVWVQTMQKLSEILLPETNRKTGRKARLNLVCSTNNKYSPIPVQPSVPGVSLCSSWPCYPIIRYFFR